MQAYNEPKTENEQFEQQMAKTNRDRRIEALKKEDTLFVEFGPAAGAPKGVLNEIGKSK